MKGKTEKENGWKDKVMIKTLMKIIRNEEKEKIDDKRDNDK